MAIDKSGFFSVPHILWHGASLYNGHLRGPATLTPIAKCLTVELSLPVFACFCDLGLPLAMWTLQPTTPPPFKRNVYDCVFVYVCRGNGICPQDPWLVLIGKLTGRTFRRDRLNQGSLSYQVWHDHLFSLLLGFKADHIPSLVLTKVSYIREIYLRDTIVNYHVSTSNVRYAEMKLKFQHILWVTVNIYFHLST